MTTASPAPVVASLKPDGTLHIEQIASAAASVRAHAQAAVGEFSDDRVVPTKAGRIGVFYDRRAGVDRSLTASRHARHVMRMLGTELPGYAGALVFTGSDAMGVHAGLTAPQVDLLRELLSSAAQR